MSQWRRVLEDTIMGVYTEGSERHYCITNAPIPFVPTVSAQCRIKKSRKTGEISAHLELKIFQPIPSLSQQEEHPYIWKYPSLDFRACTDITVPANRKVEVIRRLTQPITQWEVTANIPGLRSVEVVDEAGRHSRAFLVTPTFIANDVNAPDSWKDQSHLRVAYTDVLINSAREEIKLMCNDWLRSSADLVSLVLKYPELDDNATLDIRTTREHVAVLDSTLLDPRTLPRGYQQARQMIKEFLRLPKHKRRDNNYRYRLGVPLIDELD